MKKCLHKVKGFTLIELMVVIIIIAIIVTLVRLTPNFNQPKSRALAVAIKGIIEEVCDEALFSQKVTAMVLSPDGLRLTYQGETNESVNDWQELPNLKVSQYLQDINSSTIELTNDDDFSNYDAEVYVWKCWPTGGMTAGSIVFSRLVDFVQVDSWQVIWQTDGEVKINKLL